MLNKLSEITTTFSNASLEEAINTLQDLKSRRRDFVVPVQSMKMTDAGQVLVEGIRTVQAQELSVPGVSFQKEYILVTPNDIANRQIANRFNIPSRYWKRMLDEHPELMAKNFNGWIQKEVATKGEAKSRRMLIRSYMNDQGGSVGIFRALLSDKYLVYDSLDVLAVALKAVKAANDLHGLNIGVDKCDLSDSKLYVRFTCKDIEQEAPTALRSYRDPNNGDHGGLGISNGIITGFVLSNSEVGQGSLSIAPRVKILACSNGMVWDDEGFKRMHLGGKLSEGEAVWKQDTKAANVLLIEKQLRDMIDKYVSPDFLSQRVKDIEEMAARKLEHPVECCRNMCEAIGMNESEANAVFEQFIKQGDVSSVFSVAQAVTSYAHDCDPDRRFQLEKEATGLLKVANKCDVKPVFVTSN